MVSPAFVRKTNQDKIKRNVSKGTRLDTRIQNELESGLKAIKNGHDHKFGKHILSRPDKTTNMGFQGGISELRPTQSIPIVSNIEMHAYKRNAYSSLRRASCLKKTARAHLQQNVPDNGLLAQKTYSYISANTTTSYIFSFSCTSNPSGYARNYEFL